MSLTAAASGFVVLLLLTVPVVQGQDGWGVTYTSTEVCAFKGSTVDIHCTYTYPPRRYPAVQERFWFIKQSNGVYVDLTTDPEYSGRVKYNCENNRCTLTITNLRESDSAVYKFRFITNQHDGKFTGEPGVTVSVADFQVQVIRSVAHNQWSRNSAELRCQSSCPLPGHLSYIWYKDQRSILERPSHYSGHFYPAAHYSCAVRGHEDSRSPSLSGHWGVTYTSTQICAFKGSTVKIHCTYRYPSTINDYNTKVVKEFWFTTVTAQNEPADLESDPEYSGRVQYHCAENSCTLTITDLRESDSAVYKFRFITNQDGGCFIGSPGVTVSVSDPQLQVHVRRSTVSQYPTLAELTCHSSCQVPDQTFFWYKNGQEVKGEKNKYFYMHTFGPGDSYHCAINGDEHYPPSPSVYPPGLPSVSVSPSGQIVEGSSVTLTCSSDANPAANYTWYKTNGNLELQPLSKESLTFSSIQSSDSGDYHCTAENELGNNTSKSISIDVTYPPKLPSVSVSPSGQIVEGSSVTLTCSSEANPAATCTWYKENQQLPHEQNGIYHFTSISSEDIGYYHCKCGNNVGQINSSLFIDVQYPPKLPSVSVSPSGQIVEGSSVTLTCSSDANPAANYTWYKTNRNLELQPLSKESLTFSSIQSSDSGDYHCTAENELGNNTSKSISIDVTYPPRLLSASVSPSGQIVEGSSVNLTCSSDANPAAKYTWYKENEDSPKASGQIFTITDVRAEHSGNYYCEAQNERGRQNSTLYLTVKVFPRAQKSAVIGITAALFLAIILLSVFLLIRKKRTSKQSSEPGERRDDGEQCLPDQPGEPEEQDLYYASVRFVKNDTDPVYSNITGPRRHKEEEEEEEEGVEYSVVKFNSHPPRAQETVEDPTALYSTVNKP